MDDLREGLLAIHMTADNDWMAAKQYAKDNRLLTLEVRERCYKGPKRAATHAYSSNPNIRLDYERIGVTVIL